MTAIWMAPATDFPSSGSSAPPTSSGWFLLNRMPRVPRIRIANMEMTKLCAHHPWSAIQLRCYRDGRADLPRPCLHHTDDWLHLYGVLCAASFDWCVDICRDNAGVEVLAMLQLSTATTIVYGAAIDDVVGDGGPSRDPLGCRLADNPNPTLVLRVRVRIYPEQLTPNCSRQFI